MYCGIDGGQGPTGREGVLLRPGHAAQPRIAVTERAIPASLALRNDRTIWPDERPLPLCTSVVVVPGFQPHIEQLQTMLADLPELGDRVALQRVRVGVAAHPAETGQLGLQGVQYLHHP